MFPQPSASIYQSTKCFVTYGAMSHVDPNQVPMKGKPWTAISGLNFIHSVDLVIPETCYAVFCERFSQRDTPSHYRITMTLGQLLETSFLTEYIKNGSIMMLSEGKTTADNMFTLKQGILNLYLDRETYERAGLVGKPYGIKGDRGSKPRWIVSYDLGSQAMVHGKKGFDRLVYACKNVLDQPLTWLFCDMAKPSIHSDLLEKYSAARVTSSSTMNPNTGISQISLQLPNTIFDEGNRTELEDFSTESYEWLSLIRLGSPRVASNDVIDPYLSRYRIPKTDEAGDKVQVCTISWKGFFSPDWFRQLLVDVLVTCPSKSWFGLSATSLSRNVAGSSDELTILNLPERVGEFIMWEMNGEE